MKNLNYLFLKDEHRKLVNFISQNINERVIEDTDILSMNLNELIKAKELN